MRPQKTAGTGAVRAVLWGCLRLWITWMWLLVLVSLAGFVALMASRGANRLAVDVHGRPAGPMEVGQPTEMGQPIQIVPHRLVIDRNPVAERIAWLWPPVASIAGCVTALVLAEHFVGYRWRLVPGYRQVCLAAGAIFGAASLLIPGTLLALGSPERWAMSGLALLAFALGCWSVAWPWAMPLCLAVLVVFTPLTGFFPDVAIVFVAAGTWPGAVLCAAAGGLLLSRFVGWLVRFDEDYRCYAHWRAATALWRSTWGGLAPGRGRQTAFPLKEGFLLRWQDWWFERGLRRGPRGFAWSARRWSLGAMPIGPEIMLLLGIASVLSADLLFGLLWPNVWPNFGSKSNGGGMRVMIIVWVCCLFLFRLISFQRRPTLAVESLRPVMRKSWVLQSGASLVPRLAGAIAILAICTAVGAGPPDTGPPNDAGVPASLTWSLAGWFLSISALLASVGLIAWLRTVGPLALEIVAAFVGLYAFLFSMLASGMPGAARSDFGAKGIGLLAALAVGLLSAGLAFLRIAYRRWLVTDLE